MPVPTINSGVKYIKVNRIDSGGLDRSDYLGQLQTITLTYPDRSAIEYPIVSVQEQANYYVYGIEPGYSTSSKGEILDYSFLVYTSSFTATNTGGPPFPTNYTLLAGNSLNYFNTSSARWTFGSTPNKIVQLKISGNVDLPGVNDKIRAGITLNGATILSNNIIAEGPGTGIVFNENIIFSSSFYHPIETDYITISIYKPVGTTAIVNELYLSASLRSATPFNGSSSLVIFDPDAIDFEYNDYNALYGNAEIPQFSIHFMDVDYSNGMLTPVNFDVIISGSADRALVQDSNYASSAWSNIRYKGSRYNSFKYI